MSFTTSAGTTLSISASLPATYNQAGYEALSYTEVGEITDLGDIPDEVFELVTHQPIKTRGVQKKKGGKDLGNQTIRYALNPDDAGQALLATGQSSDDPYSVKISHPDLGEIYISGLIMGGPKNYGDVTTAATKSVTIEYTYGPAGEGPVLVAA